MSLLTRQQTTTQQARNRIPLVHGAMTTRTGLLLPPRLTLDAWRGIGEELSCVADASTWWQGDWLVYGQDRYPDRYQRALDESGLDYQTLRNYAWVARKFKPSRRRPALSLQHHAEVASLPEEEQDRWLERAQEGKWSRNKLRKHLQERRGAGGGGLADHENGTLSINIDLGQRKRWRQAAERTGQGLSTWITSVLDRAAEKALQERCPPGLSGDNESGVAGTR